MMIRAATGGGPEHGRLYRWANRTNSWSRVAIFASQSVTPSIRTTSWLTARGTCT